MRQYWVYILASRTKVIYVGMTENLPRRLHQHKHGLFRGFTSAYCVNRLVHLEGPLTLREARQREHELKGWRRSKKVELIEETNSGWEDLSKLADWAERMRWG